jgi:phosphoglycolate phosphatase-like HAD superfamily hydrolase
MVGDSIDDMTSGHMAGAATVLLVNERNEHLGEHPHTDLCISQLDDLVDILEGGFLGTRENDEYVE